MNSDNKRELKNAYKSRKTVGGVCCIRCSGNGRVWVQSTRNLEGLKNRFEFAMKIKSAPDPSMRSEWEKYGTDSFTFTVLDELEKSEEQTDREFSEDIKALYEMWLEKAQNGEL